MLTPLPVVQTLPKMTYMDVPYGSDPLQTMDIYLPAKRTVSTTKVAILIHGGAWSAGDKSDMTAYVDSFQKRMPDYAVFNINYRLATAAPSNLFPTQEMDVKAAVEFVYSRRSEYTVSPKFVMIGASAGAHLALLQGYKYGSPVKPKAVVDLFGPTDMIKMYNDPAVQSPAYLIAILMSGTPTTNASLYNYSSPIQFVTGTTCPTIILHGGVDDVVKVNQSTSLRDKLVLNGIPNQYVYYPTEGHGWTGANLTDSFNKIKDFLNQYVQ